MPANPGDRDATYKYPLVAADVLSTNHNILQALMEGGCKEKVEEEKKEDSDEEMDDAKAENKMVQSILSKDSQNNQKKE